MSEHIVIKGLELEEDAFGNNIHDCYQSGNHYGGYEIEERDDGRFTMYGDSNAYFEPLDEDTRAYVAQNLRQGRMGGQMRVKVRYKKFATPWSDYLFASPEELEAMLVPTAWQIDTVHHDPESHQYIAQIIRKP